MSEEDTKKFRDTVKEVTEEFGVKGFTAQKTAASRILGKDIDDTRKTLSEGPESIVVSSVLDNLEVAQKDLDSSRDPQAAKEILKTVKDLKQVVKNLGSQGSKDLNKDREKQLNAIINKTEKNVKRASKAGGAFGKANETFLGSLTETLNPLSQLGNFFGAAGITPLEGYFNSLGDSLNEKVKTALGYGASEESMNMTRQIQKDKEAEIATAAQEEAVQNQSVLTKDGQTSTKGKEEGEGSMSADDLLTPSQALIPLAKKRLGHALGLTSADGKSYLGQLVDFMKPDPASREEGALTAPDADFAFEGESEVPDDVKPQGIISKLFGFIGITFATLFASFKRLITAPFRLIGGLFKKLGVGIIAKIGLRGALAGTLAGIPIVGWVAALVIQGIFGIFDGIVNFFKVSKDPSATIGDKIFAFFDGFISGFFTFGLVSPDKIKEIRENITGGVFNIFKSIGEAVSNFVSNAIESFKDIGASIKDFGGKIMNAGEDFLKGTLRAILPKGDDYGALDPRKYVKMAIPESVYEYAGLDKKTGEAITEEVKPRAELTGEMRTAMSDMSNAQAQSSSSSVAVNTGGNVITSNNTTNNTQTNNSPQDKDFDYYAFRGPMVHA